MVELGKYAGAVLSSWGSALVLLSLLVALSWIQAVRVRKTLEAVEARREKRNV